GDVLFGGGGQVGLDDGEVGEFLQGTPAASRAALLHLDRANCPFRLVIGKYIEVRAGDEPQDHVLVLQEAAGDPAGVFGGGGAPADIGGQARSRDVSVTGGDVAEDAGVQGFLLVGAGITGGVAGLDEEFCHLPCPVLLPRLELV